MKTKSPFDTLREYPFEVGPDPLEERLQFARGMELAGELVQRLSVSNPRLLWEAARIMEDRADSVLEFGAAAGLRVAASELADRLDFGDER